MLSIPHMIVVFVIVLVVFGPNKLPELARGLGKLMAEFRKASTDFKSAFEQELRDIERQKMQEERKKAAEAAAAAAAAAPEQAATLATPAGTETPIASEQVAGGADASGTSNGNAATGDTRATEALVVTPAAETVARGMAENGPDVSNAANNDGATYSDKGSNNGASFLSEMENSLGKPNRSTSSQQPAEESVATNDPAHDHQQPA
jgi:sec-independent protein translocase protein TatB